MSGLAAEQPRVQTTPERVEAGASRSVEVRVAPERVGQHMAASLGGLRRDPNLPSGFLWDPPGTREPQWALLVFWEDRPQAVPRVAVAQVAIVGRTELQVETEPLATVTVAVGSASFGPAVADGQGRARVTVAVPPDTRLVEVVAVRRGRSNAHTLALTPPASPWLAFFSPARLEPRGTGTLVVAAPIKLGEGSLEVTVPESHLELVEIRNQLAFFKVTALPGTRHLAAEVRARGTSPIRAVAEAEVLAERAPVAVEGSSCLALAGSAGAFWAGGANHGFAAELTLACSVPSQRLKLFVEGSVGLRTASVQGSDPFLGALSASVLGVPIDVGLRAVLAEGRAWHLDAVGGLGPMPFLHFLSPSGSGSFTQSGLGYDVHAGLQVAWRLGRLEALGEVRGALSPAVSSLADARLGGLSLMLGGRLLP